MKKLLFILASISVFAAETETKYFCQNIDFDYVDGSINGQPMYLILKMTDGSYEQDAKISLFDRDQNPLEDSGLDRNCFDHPYVGGFDTKALICMDSDVFRSNDAVAYTKFKINSFDRTLRDTFLMDFSDVESNSNRYNFRLRSDSLRKFYCKKLK